MLHENHREVFLERLETSHAASRPGPRARHALLRPDHHRERERSAGKGRYHGPADPAIPHHTASSWSSQAKSARWLAEPTGM
jgi:hypothetical protein